MYIWFQDTGKLYDAALQLAAVGYAGTGPGRNNPEWQHVRSTGPLPVGLYEIGKPVDDDKLGPYVLWLTPDRKNKMHKRSGFAIHGDNAKGDASRGCIILDRVSREKLWTSGDTKLVVLPRDWIQPIRAAAA
jgi:hypothetical protein